MSAFAPLSGVSGHDADMVERPSLTRTGHWVGCAQRPPVC